MNIKSIKRFLKQIYYFGNNYYCPNCNSSLRTFLACGTDSPVVEEKEMIGMGKRNVSCPICFSAERDRLIYIYIKKHLSLFNKEEKINILHIAPEDCLYDNFHKKIKHENYSSYSLLF